MYISKINIINYKCYEGKFSLEFNNGINIIVGDNEAGKSTILEAVHLALSGHLHGRFLMYQLSQYLFNRNVELRYLESLKTAKKELPPSIIIEVFIKGVDLAFIEGDSNTDKEQECCITYKIEFDTIYQPAYEKLISSNEPVLSIPIEYYHVVWQSCSREAVTSRNIPLKSMLIDSTSTRFQNGSDLYISSIVRNDLEEAEKVSISQSYRRLKENFMNDSAIQAINKKVSEKAGVSDKEISISVDLSTKDAWEGSLMTYLDDIPFHQIGKGEQCLIKTNLALGHRKAKEKNLLLIEEPENHLSYSKLNQFIKSIDAQREDKQVIITTHSSFVSNKLGLKRLILLNAKKAKRIIDLSEDTQNFFMKLPGFDTLRLLLSNKMILVEGPSDELIFQAAYMKRHEGKLPIENGIDVLSVGLSFKRFLQIAEMINKKVAVITDNDGNFEEKISKKYSDFNDSHFVQVFADNRNELNTLEPQFVEVNKDRLTDLCDVIGISSVNYNTEDLVSKYMKENKTDWALCVFEKKHELKFPQYIQNAIDWCD
ncbi:MAG: hypothetical protein RL207_297 [Bacteroidota bacterium]|jgi:putative ATP-dependent endonuclease of OLD family